MTKQIFPESGDSKIAYICEKPWVDTVIVVSAVALAVLGGALFYFQIGVPLLSYSLLGAAGGFVGCEVLWRLIAFAVKRAKTTPLLPQTSSNQQTSSPSVVQSFPLPQTSSLPQFPTSKEVRGPRPLDSWFEMVETNCSESMMFLRSFDPRSPFPEDMWAFVLGQKATACQPSDKKKSDKAEWIKTLNITLESIKKLIAETKFSQEDETRIDGIKKCLETIQEGIIKEQDGTIITVKILKGYIDYGEYKDTLTDLQKFMKEVEQPRIILFMQHFYVATMTKSDNTVEEKGRQECLTQAIAKMRQYRYARDHVYRQGQQEFGRMGVASESFEWMMRTYFNVEIRSSDISDIKAFSFREETSQDRLITKICGTVGHFTNYVQGIDIETEARQDGCYPISLSEENYQQAQQQIRDWEGHCRPYQRNNNCFLVSAWVNFAVFLRYLRALHETHIPHP